jgi:hypothetical protein
MQLAYEGFPIETTRIAGEPADASKHGDFGMVQKAVRFE